MLRQPALDPGSEYYVIDHRKLLKGDVLLCTNQKSIKSIAIRKIATSNYSHALICTDPPWCVESVRHGVFSFVINRLLVNSLSHIKILRLDKRSKRMKIAEGAAHYAENQVTRKYAKKDVIAFPFRIIPQLDNGRFFCSQLVAESFRQSGLELLPGKSSLKISPGDLSLSQEFLDVTKQCTRLATDSDKHSFNGFIDGKNDVKPDLEVVQLKQKIIKKLTPTLEKLSVEAETYDDLLEKLVIGFDKGESWVPVVDSLFADAILNSGMLSLPQKYFPPHHDLYFLDVYLARQLKYETLDKEEKDELRLYYSTHLERMKKSIKEEESIAEAARFRYVLSGLESVLLHNGLSEAFQSINLRQATILKNCLKILSNTRSQV